MEVMSRQGIDISSPEASVTHFIGEGGLCFCIAMSASPCPSLKVAKTDLKEAGIDDAFKRVTLDKRSCYQPDGA